MVHIKSRFHKTETRGYRVLFHANVKRPGKTLATSSSTEEFIIIKAVAGASIQTHKQGYDFFKALLACSHEVYPAMERSS